MNKLFYSKFVRLLKTLTADEYKAFELWLKSPWCNSNKNLIRLLGKLKKYHPDFESDKLTKEKLFKQVLPQGKFSHRRMNNLLSEGYLAAERFLIHQNLSQDENLKKDLLSKELQARHLDEWFFRDMHKEITRLEEKQVKEWEDHLHLFQLHRRIYHHPNQSRRMQPGNTTIIRMGEELDLLYLLEKAAIINEKIFRNRILKDEHHEVEQDLQQWLAATEKVDHIAFDFYRRRFAYTEEKMLEQYLELRALFFKHFRDLSKKEQKIQLLYLLNDTTKLTRAKVLSIVEFLPLYKLGLETEIILHQGQLTHNTFIAIVSASNVKQDFEYTDFFIKTYSKKLAKEFQSDGFHWAKAHLANRKKESMACLDILLNHTFKTHLFQLLSKLLTAQTYFDLFLQNEQYESYLFNYFDSFEKWLLREKIGSTYTKTGFLRFVQTSRKLAKNFASPNFKPEKVKEIFKNEKNIQALNWLLRKKEEILLLRK